MVKTNMTPYKIGQFDEWRLTYSAELIKIPIEKQNEAHLDAIKTYCDTYAGVNHVSMDHKSRSSI